MYAEREVEADDEAEEMAERVVEIEHDIRDEIEHTQTPDAELDLTLSTLVGGASGRIGSLYRASVEHADVIAVTRNESDIESNRTTFDTY